MLVSPIKPIDKDFIPKSPILLLDKFMLMLCRFFMLSSEFNFSPFYESVFPIKFSFRLIRFEADANDLVNYRNPLSFI